VAKEPIALHDVVDALMQLTDEQGAFLNPSTGEIVILTNGELYAVEREEESPSLEITPERLAVARTVIESEEFAFLPTSFDINEQRIREDFCSTVADEPIRRRLVDALGAGVPAEPFPDLLRSHGLEADWQRFRMKALETTAAAWLEKNGIAFTRDQPGTDWTGSQD
jgi:hypothetical protein